MHQLDRAIVPAPPCLARLRAAGNGWNLAPADYDELHAALEQLQGRRCAYCEADLDVMGEHVEHFARRSRFPARIFDWANLFWSCSAPESCGKHKDACGQTSYGPCARHDSDGAAYADADLIDPSLDDPEEYFLFVGDGQIRPRSGLSPEKSRRAIATIRVFGLDCERLRHMRKRVAAGYLHTAEELLDLAQVFAQQDVMDLLDGELQVTRHLPFATTIKHVLTPA